jgi:hypothetical protein
MSDDSRAPGQELDAVLARFSAKGDGSRLNALDSVGGIRGIAETLLPGLVFTTWFAVSHDLWPSILAAAVVGAAFTVARLVQRQPLLQAVSGLVGIALSAFFAQRSGNAADYFLPGLWTNVISLVIFAVSIVVKWPVAGIFFGLIRGEGVEWRTNPVRLRAYQWATVPILALFALRLAVKTPLYLAGRVTELGIVHAILATPAYILGLWIAWLMSRPRPETARDDAAAIAGEDRA